MNWYCWSPRVRVVFQLFAWIIIVSVFSWFKSVFFHVIAWIKWILISYHTPPSLTHQKNLSLSIFESNFVLHFYRQCFTTLFQDNYTQLPHNVFRLNSSPCKFLPFLLNDAANKQPPGYLYITPRRSGCWPINSLLLSVSN